ncbi:MAG TPA: hypothetical protein VIJ26_04250 [Thermoanaerobaculia bacterium]|jgi:hypothetical protein
MKRTPKKLTLSRETLGLMDERRLRQVAGGITRTLACTDTLASGCCTATVCSDCC